MSRQKTTQAVILSARLNPVTSEYDRKALEIIRELEANGFNFKQIAVDAILRAGGAKPEMFERDSGTAALLARFETLLADFSTDLVRNLKSRGNLPVDDDEDDEEGVSRFASTFAKGYLQRQQQALGDDEE